MDDSPPPSTANKRPIVGAVERKGRVKARMVKHSELTAKGFKALVEGWMALKGTVLTTDELASYIPLADTLPHRTISHKVAYSKRDESYELFGSTHTNTIEGFWAIVRRAIFGQFHHVSTKYLPLYLREICYRYNDRLCDFGLDGVLHYASLPRPRGAR